MIDENTLVNNEYGEEVEKLTNDIFFFLAGKDPEISFLSLICALGAILRHNPKANFDKTSAIRIIEHISSYS